jgi:hypothetical protein
MLAKTAELEKAFDALLPVGRLTASPRKELLEAARAWSEEVWQAGSTLGPLPLSPEQLNQGLNLVQHPVFICGVHRSGTTLVRDLLDAHPALAVLPAEGSFRTNLAAPLKRMTYEQGQFFLATAWLRRLANPINQPPYWLLGRSTGAASGYVTFARAFCSWYGVLAKSFKPGTTTWPHLAVVLAYATCYEASGAGLATRFWVDKTPANERYLQQIWQEMPEAKIIHVVRAPVDVFLSRKRMEPALNLKTCLQDLQLSYWLAVKQARLNPDRYLVLHYEELCKHPSAAIASLTAFLGIEQLPCLFTPTVAGKPAQVNSSFIADLPAGGILDSQVYLHPESCLQKQEGKLLSAYLFKPAAQLGYTLKPIGKIPGRLATLKLQVQSCILAVVARGKRYKRLGIRGSIKVFVTKIWSG